MIGRFAIFESGAGVMELVDIGDLKSPGPISPCRFESGLRHLYDTETKRAMR